MMGRSLKHIVTSLLCAEVGRDSEWVEDNAGSCNGDLPGCMQSGQSFLQTIPTEDDEVITLLMQKEENLMKTTRDYVDSYQGNDEEMRMRARMINWMLDVHAHYGFYPRTAFLSVSYFDRFLSNHVNSRGKPWLLQLVAVGCISLAAKLEETEVPLLLDLQVGDVQHVFESCTIQRMELLIMSTLNWEMSSVTPFSYLHYLLHNAGFLDGLSQPLITRSEELILHSCRDFRFSAYSPSVVAVASLLCACKEEMPLQEPRLKQALLSLWPVKEISALEWMRLMDEMLHQHPSWTSTSSKAVSEYSLSVPNSPMGVLDANCFSSESCDRTLNTSSTKNCASGHVCKMLAVNATSGSHTAVSNDVAVTSPTSSLPPNLPPKRRKLSEQYIQITNKPLCHLKQNPISQCSKLNS